MEDALLKMKEVLAKIDLSAVKSGTRKDVEIDVSVSERLRRIEKLKVNGLISEDEYSTKREEILDSL